MKHLIIDSNTELNQKNKYHIVPCQLQTNGQKVPDCQVSNYFESTISTQLNEQTKSPELSGTIHGHKMVGTKHENIDGLYTCLCYRKQGTQDIEMIAIEKVNNLTEWRKDIGWKKNEGHLGSTMMYYELMNALHQDIDQGSEDVNKQIEQVII